MNHIIPPRRAKTPRNHRQCCRFSPCASWFPKVPARERGLVAQGLRLQLIGILWLILAPGLGAQEPYRTPPQEVVEILEAPWLPAVSVSPDRRHLLFVERETLPPLADLAAPMLRLAGWRINPENNALHRPRQFTGMILRTLDPERLTEELTLPIPPDANVGFPDWSPDGSRFAFTLTWPDGIELWVGEAATGEIRRITERNLNGTFFPASQWLADNRTLLLALIPEDRGPPPERPLVPEGPAIQESTGRTATVPTFQDLLQDDHDEELFEHYWTSQLVYVDSTTGEQSKIAEPAIYARAEPSPDNQYLLLSQRVRPYSRIIGFWAFPETVEIRDRKGDLVQTLANLPLRDDTPIQGVAEGPRSITWHPAEEATLVWAEAVDGGDPRNPAPDGRDRILRWRAPFTGDPAHLFTIEHRFRSILWFPDPTLAYITEFDRDRRWLRTREYNLADPEASPRTVWDHSLRERYNHPGTPRRQTLPTGGDVALLHNNALFLTGPGATPEGNRPFLDRMDLASLETERLWICEGEVYEFVVELLSDDGNLLLTRYESPTQPPNYFWMDQQSGKRMQLTDYPDPAPSLQGIRRELVTYPRADGVPLTATLLLPPGYTEGEPLPLLLWAYPREFSDPETAGQVTDSPYRFTLIGGASHLFALTQGYAILDNATMPVIGDPETMNDTFVEQIVASAAAAIEYAVDRGIADRSRVAVGGHSYGAFMTANLLAHSDLFRAGIARSGAYNRTLTPFGFQAERRTLWEATESYTRLSPFFHAHQITTPILLIHGQIDNNPGTYPMQSERLYQAINGHGGTARLVMMPYEGHGFQARESVYHVLAEMLDWLNTHLVER